MKKQILQLRVNGEDHELLVSPNRTLLDILRDDLGLTGTKEGCSTGDCGACTVLLEGEAVTSCLVLALDAEGKDVVTIEGLTSSGQLHPIQQAFIDHWAIQCGFCSPGLVLSAVALLRHNPCPTEDEVRRVIAGNLCRCTGYAKIVDAIMAVVHQGDGTGQGTTPVRQPTIVTWTSATTLAAAH